MTFQLLLGHQKFCKFLVIRAPPAGLAWPGITNFKTLWF